MTKDPYKYFRIEARELVEELGQGAIALERDGDPREVVARLLRVAHTLKGAARVVKQPQIADLAHQLEDVLAPHRDARARLDAVADRLLALADAIAARVTSLDEPPEATAPPTAHGAPAISAPVAPQTVRVALHDMDSLLHAVAEVSALLTTVHKESARLEDTQRAAAALAEQLTLRDPSALALTRLRAQAEDVAARLARHERALDAGVEQASAELLQLRDTADRLRLMPADAIFPALERAARDAAQALGKQVTFGASGGDARLDVHVLEALRVALLHAVRNAVAHGVEAPAARTAAGKPSAGHVSVRVTQRGSTLVFACSDDGAGVDVDAVRAAAAQRGLADAHALGLDDVLALLVRGGLSTARVVDELSGRGVGLDAIRAVAAQLRGTVHLRSDRGRGAVLEVTVPVTLVATRALAVEVDGVVLSMPLDAVRCAVRVTEDDLTRTAERETIVSEGEIIPFVPLRRLLGVGAGDTARRGGSALVITTAEGSAAIGVDRLLGATDLVARPLPAMLRAAPIVVGAALDAEGNPRLVLDPVGVVLAARAARPAVVVAKPPRPPILIVDDSLTTRMLEQAILESAGYEVELASSAEEALERVRLRRYALFLVDVEMPGVDGFELVTRLQADATTRDIPAIMVTSRGSDEDRRRAVAAGARAHVIKGEFDQGKLLATIRRWTA